MLFQLGNTEDTQMIFLIAKPCLVEKIISFLLFFFNLGVVQLVTSKGYDVDSLDGDVYTPLMLTAREGHAHICKLLSAKGACCEVKNLRGETALSLARKNNGRRENEVECVILELARRMVCMGGCLKKHTRGGKGSPHPKMVKMVEAMGILTWGSSSQRKVICREAEAGPSVRFRKNRRGKGDADDGGMFHVVTSKNKEVHFCV